jgi:hypothetical protein
MTNPLSAEHLIALSAKDVAATALLRRKRNVQLKPDATGTTRDAAVDVRRRRTRFMWIDSSVQQT